LRLDQHPTEALRTGADRAICGACPLRGVNGSARACYVSVAQAPSAVWRALQRGDYPALPGVHVFRHQLVRYGAYGDPAAVPLRIWEAIAERAAGFTGYTHQWRTADPRYSRYLMASADSPEDRA